MIAPRPTLLAAIACALLLLTPSTLGQNTADWQGQDSEFGSIRAPYTATIDGQRASVEARVTLRDHYTEQDSRFFMFAFTVENTPLDVRFDNLIRTDTGEELPCYQRQGDAASAIKCFVDLKDMPPVGTEIQMKGSFGAKRTGMFQAGAMVVPFSYTWLRVRMDNGLNAELYAGTQMSVVKAIGGGGLGGDGNGPLAKIPNVGFVGIVAAGAAAALAFSAGRPGRRRP